MSYFYSFNKLISDLRVPMFKKIIIILVLSLFTQNSYATNKRAKIIKSKGVTKTQVVKATIKKEEPQTCKALLLLDATTGDVLFENNSHQSLPPASMTKLMSSYVILKKIKEGSLGLADLVTISGHCSKIGGSQVYLKEKEQFSVGQLLEALLIQSANDAAVALAEHVGGSVEGFVEMMNEEAKTLGMKESEFHSPHGLPPALDQKPDLVSANDFGILSRALIHDYPEIIQYTGKAEADFRNAEFKMNNHNKLLNTFPGCDGLKTGYYGEAGFSVTATAVRNGARIISVAMGCNNRKFRDAEAARLLSQGFSQFKSVKLIDKGAAVEGVVKIQGGEKQDVSLITADSVNVVLRKGAEEKIKKIVSPCDSLQAPVGLASTCGTISFQLENKEVGRVDLLTAEPIKAASMFQKVKQKVGL